MSHSLWFADMKQPCFTTICVSLLTTFSSQTAADCNGQSCVPSFPLYSTSGTWSGVVDATRYVSRTGRCKGSLKLLPWDLFGLYSNIRMSGHDSSLIKSSQTLIFHNTHLSSFLGCSHPHQTAPACSVNCHGTLGTSFWLSIHHHHSIPFCTFVIICYFRISRFFGGHILTRKSG